MAVSFVVFRPVLQDVASPGAAVCGPAASGGGQAGERAIYEGGAGMAAIPAPFSVHERTVSFLRREERLYFFECASKMDAALPINGGKPEGNHVLQLCFQVVIVTVEIVENTGRVKLTKRDF